jgi:cytochrome c oxidase cbb3-type subunit 2
VNRSIFIFLGILATLALSFWGLIFIPQVQIGRQEAVLADDAFYPPPRSGLAKKGAAVYRSEGCAECHSQQVRDKHFGSDIDRGWGARFTVAQDYIGDSVVLLGSERIGPDLVNVGLRKPDLNWQLQHLYDPRSLVPNSMMPPYRYLFEKHRLGPGEKPSERALKFASTPPGYEIVPTDSAEALVAYLASLRSQVELFESPVPKPPGSDTNAVPAQATGTNATNAASAPTSPQPVPAPVK